MIGVFYTGQVRHNLDIARQNHQQLMIALGQLDDVHVYDCTDIADSPYTASGARQLWQFAQSLERVQADIIIRLRTDLWFEKSAIDCIIKQVRAIQQQQTNTVFFGSDIANHQHQELERITEVDELTLRVLDLVIVSRNNLNGPEILRKLNAYANPTATGNELFLIVAQGQNSRNVVCPIWLIRQDYEQYPTDQQVCLDHIQSYVKPHTLHILQPVLEWAKNR